jgi:hypothetical protein
LNPQAWTFLFGFLGSAMAEGFVMVRFYERSGRLPPRYGKPGFCLTRIGLALAAGMLALAYQPGTHILAVHIGASAPLIVGSLMEREPA